MPSPSISDSCLNLLQLRRVVLVELAPPSAVRCGQPWSAAICRGRDQPLHFRKSRSCPKLRKIWKFRERPSARPLDSKWPLWGEGEDSKCPFWDILRGRWIHQINQNRSFFSKSASSGWFWWSCFPPASRNLARRCKRCCRWSASALLLVLAPSHKYESTGVK